VRLASPDPLPACPVMMDRKPACYGWFLFVCKNLFGRNGQKRRRHTCLPHLYTKTTCRIFILLRLWIKDGHTKGRTSLPQRCAGD